MVRLLKEFKGDDQKVATAYYKKLEFARVELAWVARRHDKDMRKTLGRGYATAYHDVAERDNSTCAECNRSAINIAEEELSLHLAYRKEPVAVEDRANPANLRLVCTACLYERAD